MKEEKTTGGIGFCGALTILFVALKLLKIISWSWIWVLSPIWLPTAVFFAGAILWLIIKAIAHKAEKMMKGERK